MPVSAKTAPLSFMVPLCLPDTVAQPASLLTWRVDVTVPVVFPAAMVTLVEALAAVVAALFIAVRCEFAVAITAALLLPARAA
jgi:hypothetical protein